MSQSPLPTDGGSADVPPATTSSRLPVSVERALPRAPAELLVAGDLPREWLQELAAAGFALHRTAHPEDIGRLLRGVAGPTAVGSKIEGVIIHRPMAAASESTAVEGDLAEASFCLRFEGDLGEDLEGGGRLLVARRDPFAVRSLRPGDEDQILDLFAGSFHHRRPIEHWRWEYRDNPRGGPFVSLACDAEGRIVAHYAGYPVRFRDRDGEVLDAFQIGDTMTVPSVRHVGRGPTSLLARTGRHFYARACRGRVAFNYGFNVGNIQKFSIRFLAAERIEAVPYRRLAGKALATLAASRWRLPWHRYRALACRLLDERWDRFFDRVAKDYGLLAERRARDLRWRYLDRPGFDYRIHAAFHGRRLVAWGVFLRRAETLLWGDALVDPRHPRSLTEVLRSALRSDEAQGVTTVEGWFSRRPGWLAPLWAQLGFEEAPEPQDLSLMCVPFTLPEAAAKLRRDLYYTLGDSDLF